MAIPIGAIMAGGMLASQLLKQPQEPEDTRTPFERMGMAMPIGGMPMPRLPGGGVGETLGGNYAQSLMLARQLGSLFPQGPGPSTPLAMGLRPDPRG